MLSLSTCDYNTTFHLQLPEEAAHESGKEEKIRALLHQLRLPL